MTIRPVDHRHRTRVNSFSPGGAWRSAQIVQIKSLRWPSVNMVKWRESVTKTKEQTVFGRFRNKQRDIETDIERVTPIRHAVETAMRAAEAELRGLNQRMASLAAEASFLFGDGLDSAVDDDPRGREKLKQMEEFLSRGEMRLRYLTRQLSTLSDVQGKLDAIITPPAAPAR
jgi:hypothetical protein